MIESESRGAPLRPQAMQRLVERAATCVAAALRGEAPPPVASVDDPALEESRGCFVTLRRGGELAGCIGYAEGQAPLLDQVGEAARLAATRDGRFEPLRSEDLPSLEIEVSVLSPLEPVAPEEIVVGRDGLVLRGEGRSGLLLPQVAVENGLDREGFLRALCRKAGLPPRAWEDPHAQLLRFTAQVHAESWRPTGGDGS